MIYLNEFDPFAAQWCRRLSFNDQLPLALVDERSIKDVEPSYLEGFRQCHFFAGIGGWPLALRLAGYDHLEDLWTGSCPCQDFSTAGKQKGIGADRDLWPVFFNLIRECRPQFVFGEQVANAIRHGWLDRVFRDLEGAGYIGGAAVLGAHSVGSPHIRQRLYWGFARVSYAKNDGAPDSVWARKSDSQWGGDGLARLQHADNNGREQRGIATSSTRYGSSANSAGGIADWLQHAYFSLVRGLPPAGEQSIYELHAGHVDGLRNSASDQQRRERQCGSSGTSMAGGSDRGMVYSNGSGRRTQSDASIQTSWEHWGSAWADFTIASFRDGKKRRVGSGVQPLAYGIPRSMGRGRPELSKLLRRAGQNRTGRLKGYGNAIVPQVAAVFVRAFMESIGQ